MPPAPEEASGNRTLATIIFVVEDYGRSILDLHDSRLKYVDPITADVLTMVSGEYNGYFRNTFLSDVRGSENPPGSGLYPPDGVIGIWDFSYCGLEYGKSM